MKKRILILGATGRIGSAIKEQLTASKKDQIFSPTHSEFDLENLDLISEKLQNYRPDIIVNAAGYTAVDNAENEREKAKRLNVEMVAGLAYFCQQNNVRLIHFSTDYVFNGKGKTPWMISSQRDPLGYYAKTKAMAEDVIEQIAPSFVIARVGWIHNGLADFFSAILKKALLGERLAVVDDQWGTPTSTRTVAAWTEGILKESFAGIAHVAPRGYASRFETASWALDCASKCYEQMGKLNLAEQMQEAKRNMIATVMSPESTRPKNCRLEKFPKHIPMPTWQEDVKGSVEIFCQKFS